VSVHVITVISELVIIVFNSVIPLEEKKRSNKKKKKKGQKYPGKHSTVISDSR
jgi:hypothetical protein